MVDTFRDAIIPVNRHAETSATVFHTSPAAAAAERRKTQEQKKNSLDVERRLNQRRTRIVATIGPSSESPEVLAELLEAGLDVARINYSHGTPEDKTDLIATLREAERAHGRPLGILADLPGPKVFVSPLPRCVRGPVKWERV